MRPYRHPWPTPKTKSAYEEVLAGVAALILGASVEAFAGQRDDARQDQGGAASSPDKQAVADTPAPAGAKQGSEAENEKCWIDRT